MEKIIYSVISRGELEIKYNGNTYKILGELIFNPATFYADLSALHKIQGLNEDEKYKLVDFIEKDSIEKIGTKIIFD
jgi:hypothetical protein